MGLMNSEIDMALGRRLRALRQARGLSQTAVADHLGITFQQVQKYENGTNRISVATLIGACRLLTVSPAEFLDGLTDGAPSQHFSSTRSSPAVAIEAIEDARVKRAMKRLIIAISEATSDERRSAASEG